MEINFEWLEEQAERQLKEAQANLEAVRRAAAFHKSLVPTATASDIRHATLDILKANGPMYRKQIYDYLKAIGVRLNGKDPVATLGATLSRFSDDFQPYGDGKWGLRDQDHREHTRDGVTPTQGHREHTRDGVTSTQGHREHTRVGVTSTQGHREHTRVGVTPTQGHREHTRVGVTPTQGHRGHTRVGVTPTQGHREHTRDGVTPAQDTVESLPW